MEDEKIDAAEAPDGGIQLYKIDVEAAVLTDLVKRLEKTRWSPQIESMGWSGGTDVSYLRGLVGYWREGYDWRNEERKLNQFAHYRTKVDGTGIHFIYERGKGSSNFPLILTHGYPDSFYRFVKLIPLLTDPTAYGGRAEDAFDVVVPDIPGYGFSDKPDKMGATFR